jgi:hypothetical protein
LRPKRLRPKRNRDRCVYLAKEHRAQQRQRLDLLDRHEAVTIPDMRQRIVLLEALVEKQFVYAQHLEHLVSKVAMRSLAPSDSGLNSSSSALSTPSCRTSRRMFAMQRCNSCCTRGRHRR